ncbi:MAG: 50S ribosomal protein L22 [Candidatus Omnitrophota bacterium]|nr:50S ribosomal protein L22 [Candidatus Omnitrophota bacterium]
MIAKAVSKYTRISPKKARLLTRPLKGLLLPEAYAFLMAANKRASHFIYNLLKSAASNARKKEPSIDETNLYISKITADSGPVLKRYRAASMGRAFMIRKRTSHLTVHLDEKKPARKKFAAAKTAAKTGKKAIFRKRTKPKKKIMEVN